jgi:hypothetical protein
MFTFAVLLQTLVTAAVLRKTPFSDARKQQTLVTAAMLLLSLITVPG